MIVDCNVIMNEENSSICYSARIERVHILLYSFLSIIFITHEISTNKIHPKLKITILMLASGMSLNIKFSKGNLDISNIISSIHINIKNNDTNYCENVLISSESDFTKSHFNNLEAKKAINVSLHHVINVFMTPSPYLSGFGEKASLFRYSRMASGQMKSITKQKSLLGISKNFVFKKSFDHVIHTGCPYLDVYGHFIWDLLCPLQLFDPKLIQISKFFVQSSLREIEICALKNLYNINEDQLEFVSYRTSDMRSWYFVKNLYILDANFPLENYQILTPKLVKYAKEKYQISSQTPFRYFLHNREINFTYRVIRNFDELVSVARKEFPKIEWIVENPKTKTFYEIIHFYDSVRFYFTPSGSDVFQALFMQPKTVVLIAMTVAFNVNDISACHSAKVFTIVFLWPGLKNHHDKRSKPIPPDSFSNYLRIGIDTLRISTFPKGLKLPLDKSRCWN